jgi:RNA polymerase sigma-70 factor, ECF subfamily
MEFLEIHDRYYERVRKFILASVKDASVADDLIQETFLRIQEGRDRLRDPSKMKSWIFRIAYNLCQDHFRARKGSSPIEGIEKDLIDLEESSIQKKLEQEEMSQCIQDKINLLPESLRSVVIFADVMDFSLQEIADILGLSLENVKVRLHRARKKLKVILEEKCTFEIDERSVLVCEPADQKGGK